MPARTRPEWLPNIVLIVSDDMGYSDIPRLGDTDIATPALDRLADEGCLFTNGYVTAPICSPSRMGILSGRYQQRSGVYDIYYQRDISGYHLWVKQKTIADYLQNAGYRTGLVGKWHAGEVKEPWGAHPMEKGFDEYVGIPGGMSSYLPGVELYRGHEPFEAPKYLTEYFGDEACAFIDRNAGNPFFLYLGFNAVHAPLEAMDEDLQALGEYPSPDRKTYAGMLRAMDRNIGRVLDTLDGHGLAQNTLVFFINDNGGGGNHTPEHTRNTAHNRPLRGYKFDLYEGGIRVPYLVRFPGRVEAGRVEHRVVSALDIAPTALAAAGIEPTEDLDGVDLLPWLAAGGRAAGAGRSGGPPAGDTRADDPHPVLCWQNRVWAGSFQAQKPLHGFHNQAIRKGRWKMVRRMVPLHDLSCGEPWELYDLSVDVGEAHNLAPEYPGVVNELYREFNRWHSGMTVPQEGSVIQG
jgi:arylsulfatase A-like enzyme